MKKKLYGIRIIVLAVLFSSTAFADDDDWGRGGYGYGDGYEHHGGRHHHGHHGWGGYPGQPVNNYYPQPQVNYNYQPQQPYYPPQPQYNKGGGYYDNRSHQGLAGGVVGSVLGYEMGNGNPLVAGLGAAAGSFLGNGAAWR